MPSPAALPLLKVSHLHPRGDWYAGVRLPEFVVMMTDENHKQHELHITGRYLQCRSAHTDPLVRSMTLKAMPCQEYKEDWEWRMLKGRGSFATYINMRPPVASKGEQELEKARQCLAATMVTALEAQYQLSTKDAIALMDEATQVRENPASLDYLLTLGLTTQYWINHLRYKNDAFLRPDFIDPEQHILFAGVDDWLSYLNYNKQRDHDLSQIHALEDQVNVWGCTEELQDDHNFSNRGLLQAIVACATPEQAQAVIKNAYRRYYITSDEKDEKNKERLLDLREPDPAYLNLGLPINAIDAYSQHHIAPKLAEFWIRQGLVKPESIEAAQKLLEQRPEVGPGKIAWAAQHPERFISGVSWDLPPEIPQEKKPKPRHNNRVGNLAVSPSWWQEITPSVDATETVEEDSLALSV